jgi:predicted RecA/RadA family phage recombinase
MATNITEYLSDYGRSVTVTHPATPASGDPVLWNSITGVAITDEGDGQNDATDTTVLFGDYVATVRVIPYSGPNDGRVQTTVVAGDAIYYDSTQSATESSALNLNTDGVFFGYAVSSVASAAGVAGAEISVWHIQ